MFNIGIFSNHTISLNITNFKLLKCLVVLIFLSLFSVYVHAAHFKIVSNTNVLKYKIAHLQNMLKAKGFTSFVFKNDSLYSQSQGLLALKLRHIQLLALSLKDLKKIIKVDTRYGYLSRDLAKLGFSHIFRDKNHALIIHNKTRRAYRQFFQTVEKNLYQP